MAREPILQSPADFKDDDRDLRPQRMQDMVGQREVYARLEIAVDAASKRGEPLGHILFDGPPGLGKTTFAMCIPRDLGVGFPDCQRRGPGRPQGRDPLSDQRRGTLRAVHRRNPSAAEGGRGVSVPGDGGFSHRPDARRGGQRPDDQHAVAAVHADRGHHPHRTALGPVARPLSTPRAPRLLHGGGTGRDRAPQREEAAGGDRR